MLHKISSDHCRDQLDWIVNLQRRILSALCQQNVDREGVTSSWITGLLVDVDPDWLQRWLTKKDGIVGSGKNLLEDMRLIAGLDLDTKKQLLVAFENDQRLADMYSDDTDTGVSAIGLRDLESPVGDVALIVRSFFEIFYSPTFYRQFGYRIGKSDGTIIQYDRDLFIEEFQKANDLYVCPFCDGDIGNAEVDHFLPKAKYPFLSCNALNLIPICGTCNSRSCKGEKIPLDSNSSNPSANWLHPYLRPAVRAYEIRFDRPPIGGLTAGLYDRDQLQQCRLDNFADLVQLRKTWAAALSRRVRASQRKIDGHRRRVGKQSLGTAELQTKLTEWAENEADEIGLISFSIVGSNYLRNAASQDPLTWDELWTYNTTTAVQA